MGSMIFFTDMASVVSGVNGGRGGLVIVFGKLAIFRDDVEVKSIEELSFLESDGARTGGSELGCAKGCADKVLARASCAGGTEKGAIAVIEGKG